MKKSTKRIMLSTLLGAFALCSTLSITNLASASANTLTIDTVSSFAMMDGASVRLDADDPGIRFSATMSVSEYQGLVETYGENNIEFGTFIMSANYENKVDSIANPDVYFGANPTFGWYIDDTTYVGGQTQILQMDSDVYEYTDTKTNKTFMRVNGAVNKILPQNLMREYVGISYIKVTEPTTSTVEYKMATLQEDRARTVIYVAQQATENPEYASSQTVLENFVSDYVEYYKAQNSGNVPTVQYSVDVYDHDTYLKTLSGEEYTANLNGTATYEVPSENREYLDEEKSVLSARALANDKTVLKVVYNKTHKTVKYEKAETDAKAICSCGFEETITLKEYDDAVLKFDTDSSKNIFGIISSLASQSVENGVAVVKISNFGGFNNNADGELTDRATSGIRLNLSGAYKLGEIGRIDIKLKQNVDALPNSDGVVNGTDELRVWANRTEYTDKLIASGATLINNNQLNAIQLTSFKASDISATEYQTVSITSADIWNIYETTGFTADTSLNVLSMAYTNGGIQRCANLLIDEIKIFSKAQVAQEMNSVYAFNDESCLSLISFGGSSATSVASGIAYENGTISNVKIGTTSGCYCYANISLGGIFTVADLESITVNIETDANTSTVNDYIDVLLNHSSFNDNASTADRPTSGTTRVSFTRKAGKISVTFTMANTGLTENTTLDKLSLAFSAGGKSALTFLIDSIVFNLAN